MREIITILLYVAIGLNLAIFGLGATLADTDMMVLALLSTASCALGITLRSEDKDDSE